MLLSSPSAIWFRKTPQLRNQKFQLFCQILRKYGLEELIEELPQIFPSHERMAQLVTQLAVISEQEVFDLGLTPNI
ncbi:MAG: hypothetical protein P8P30_07385 [Rickettsiales bacterium]|nr:hypothetical protein [Rickettsiales bacterium]